MEKPEAIPVVCPCCQAEFQIHPWHPKYEELILAKQIELQLEAHPEISPEDEEC